MSIRSHLAFGERLAILRAKDQIRTWNSLDDERVCVLCEKLFRGREVEITCDRDGEFQLRCPTAKCNAGPSLWVYPGNPLISDAVYADWWRAVADPEEDSFVTEVTGSIARHA